MDKLSLRQLAEEATLIVDDRLAAVQLEAHLLGIGDRAERGAWKTPDIRTHGAWAASAWSAQRNPDRLPLNAAQSAALWHRLIAASNDDGALLHIEQLAAWAAEAWRLLLDWRLDVRELRAREGDIGFGSFLRWAADYRQRLRDGGWIDAAELNGALCDRDECLEALDGALVWADPFLPSPAFEGLVSRARAMGADVGFWQPPAAAGAPRKLMLADRREELRAAMLWAQRKLADQPGARIALVVPPEGDNELLLERCGATEWALGERGEARVAAVALEGRAADREPVIGAALDCLGLFSRRADFSCLSRCLRSPFLAATTETRAARSLVEVELRSELTAQIGFLDAFRSGGLRSWLAARAPELARVLEACLDRLVRAPRFQSTTHWARFAQETLAAFGWPGTPAGLPSQALDTWDRMLVDFASLTPVLGAIEYERALSELTDMVARMRVPSAVPLAGITVLERAEQLGAGYDAAWVTGMSDRAWPRPARPNPLLPLALQAAHGMPFATPADALARCRAIMARLIVRVPELVFSYPSIENDYAAAPSPLLAEIETLEGAAAPHGRGLQLRSAQRASIERIADPIPPLEGSVIAGGATTLAVQARCPLRAFVESRLAARSLERVQRGIAPRQRGMLTHRALELLLTDCSGRDALAALSPEALHERIRASAVQAFAERLRGSSPSLRAHMRLERDRVAALAAALVARDLERGDFAIDGLEVRHTARIAGLQARCRIDRIDRLADGRLAIIDYKTGQSATPSDWLRPRLLEPQLPLYLQALGDQVGAIVFGMLQPGNVAYRGLCDPPEAFGGRMQRLPAGVDWSSQRERWAEQLTQLATEFAAGDGRIFLVEAEAAAGALAPLTRVYEQLADFRPDAVEEPE